MDNTNQGLDALKDIKRIMERSSRFISLSGWSGISAGICALAGAWLASYRIKQFNNESMQGNGCIECLKYDLLLIATIVFLAAFISATFFTYFKSRKDGVPIWGTISKRLLWNTMLPLLVGAVFILRLIYLEYYDLIAASCLIFYGLALINGSKYTMGEIKYLGYSELILGFLCLFTYQTGFIFWVIGFGILHIVYGIAMWWVNERKNEELENQEA